MVFIPIIGGALVNALDFAGNNFLYRDDGSERKRCDDAMIQLAKDREVLAQKRREA